MPDEWESEEPWMPSAELDEDNLTLPQELRDYADIIGLLDEIEGTVSEMLEKLQTLRANLDKFMSGEGDDD